MYLDSSQLLLKATDLDWVRDNSSTIEAVDNIYLLKHVQLKAYLYNDNIEHCQVLRERALRELGISAASTELRVLFFQRVIDYLKFDVEGYEWGVIQDLIKFNSLRETIKQIGFEIHTRHIVACGTTPGFQVTEKNIILIFLAIDFFQKLLEFSKIKIILKF